MFKKKPKFNHNEPDFYKACGIDKSKIGKFASEMYLKLMLQGESCPSRAIEYIYNSKELTLVEKLAMVNNLDDYMKIGNNLAKKMFSKKSSVKDDLKKVINHVKEKSL